MHEMHAGCERERCAGDARAPEGREVSRIASPGEEEVQHAVDQGCLPSAMGDVRGMLHAAYPGLVLDGCVDAPA